MKKMTQLFILMVFLFQVQACFPTCSGLKSFETEMMINGVTLVEKVELGATESFKPDEPLFYDQYFLFFSLQTIAGEQMPVPVAQFKLMNVLFPPAYACSPSQPTQKRVVKNKIKSIEFVSNKLYDDRHPAGTSLLDILTHVEKNNTLNIILPELIANLNGEQLAENFSFELKFAVPPSDINEHTFSAKVTLESGEVFQNSQIQMLKPRS